MTGEVEFRTLSEAEVKARRKRSIAIALILGALVIVFFVTTLVRLGGNVADRVI